MWNLGKAEQLYQSHYESHVLTHLRLNILLVFPPFQQHEELNTFCFFLYFIRYCCIPINKIGNRAYYGTALNHSSSLEEASRHTAVPGCSMTLKWQAVSTQHQTETQAWSALYYSLLPTLTPKIESHVSLIHNTLHFVLIKRQPSANQPQPIHYIVFVRTRAQSHSSTDRGGRGAALNKAH